jgi:hypothetical protein
LQLHRRRRTTSKRVIGKDNITSRKVHSKELRPRWERPETKTPPDATQLASGFLTAPIGPANLINEPDSIHSSVTIETYNPAA